MNDLLKALGSGAVEQLLQSLHQLEFRSSVLPTKTVDIQSTFLHTGSTAPTTGATPGGGKGWKKRAIKIIHPVVEVRTAYGPLRYAPAGEPPKPGALFPVVVGVAAGAVALALGVVGSTVAQGPRAGIPLALAAAVGFGVYEYQRRQG